MWDLFDVKVKPLNKIKVFKMHGLESELEIYLLFFTVWCYKRTCKLIVWSVEKILKFKLKDFSN